MAKKKRKDPTQEEQAVYALYRHYLSAWENAYDARELFLSAFKTDLEAREKLLDAKEKYLAAKREVFGDEE